MVFPAGEDGGFTETGKNYMLTMTANGLELLSFRGVNKESIFVLIRGSTELLRNYADEVDFPMLMDPVVLEDMARKGNLDKGIAGFEIADFQEESPYSPYEYLYGKYSIRMPENLYKSLPGESSPFHCTIRAKLLNQIVHKKPPNNGVKLTVARFISKGTLKGYFPLHNATELEVLKANWLKWPVIPWSQPFDQLARYFGEKIAMFFVFQGHYSRWCVFAGIVGIPLQIAVFVMNNYSAPFLPFFAYFIALWGVVMLEFWKRKEGEWALKWGTLGCETTETDRADFEGTPMKSYIDGTDIMYFSTKKRKKYMRDSAAGVLVLIALVLGAVASIYIIRFSLQPYIGANAQTVASFINSAQIQIAGFVYNSLAQWLNERENHRTETKHEDSLIAKIFLFAFVNNYASFFYLAFFAELFGDCPPNKGGCMVPLTTNLAIIFVSRTIVDNMLGFTLPWLSVKYRRRDVAKHAAGTDRRVKVKGKDMIEVSRPESEFTLEPYESRQKGIDDFTELAIQFGYASMFATALPMAPFLSFLSNVVGCTCRSWKLVHLHRRPLPTSCEDIGTWQSILTIVSIASVMSNASITVFTMSVTNSFSYYTRFWLYLGFQWTCFVVQVIIMELIPDVPESVTIQQQRQEFLIDKIINQVPDDDLGDLEAAPTGEFVILDGLASSLQGKKAGKDDDVQPRESSNEKSKRNSGNNAGSSGSPNAAPTGINSDETFEAGGYVKKPDEEEDELPPQDALNISMD
jgi:hypothetical protein